MGNLREMMRVDNEGLVADVVNRGDTRADSKAEEKQEAPAQEASEQEVHDGMPRIHDRVPQTQEVQEVPEVQEEIPQKQAVQDRMPQIHGRMPQTQDVQEVPEVQEELPQKQALQDRMPQERDASDSDAGVRLYDGNVQVQRPEVSGSVSPILLTLLTAALLGTVALAFIRSRGAAHSHIPLALEGDML